MCKLLTPPIIHDGWYYEMRSDDKGIQGILGVFNVIFFPSHQLWLNWGVFLVQDIIMNRTFPMDHKTEDAIWTNET